MRAIAADPITGCGGSGVGRLEDAAGAVPEVRASCPARILVVDDNPSVLAVVRRTLARGGYGQVQATTKPERAIEWIDTSLPDLVVLDIHMPRLDGYAVLQHLRSRAPAAAFLPVIAITGEISPQTARRALDLGANDLVRKPFDALELLLRVRNLLKTRELYIELELERRSLEQRVRCRTSELGMLTLDGLRRLARASEYRDDLTGRHTQRVGELAGRIAAALGWDAEAVERIRVAATLHDVGKIGIPDEVLLKNGPLSEEERRVMQRHTRIGEDLLSGGTSEVMRLAAVIARSHHERFDGAGYPDGLAGEEIPLEGRIVAVADFFDAVSTERHYRAAWTVERAVAEVRERAGSHFDPRVVSAFLSGVGEEVRGR